MEDPTGIGIAYIIPDCPCECCRTGDPMKYVKHAKSKQVLFSVTDKIGKNRSLFGKSTKSRKEVGSYGLFFAKE